MAFYAKGKEALRFLDGKGRLWKYGQELHVVTVRFVLQILVSSL